jgi:hypothetical protein
MSYVLEDLSAPALAAAVKANPVEWWRYLGRSPKAEFCDSPGLTWLRTGISNSFVNCVLRAQREPDHTETVIEETLARFGDLSAMSWWTGPGTQPTDLGEHLLAHGLVHTGGRPGRAVDLLALREDVPAP